MSDSGTLYIEMLEIEKRNPSRNLNGHNFSHGCPIQAHNISKRSKMNNGGSQEIPMVITYPTDVRFGDVIYRDFKIEQQNFSTNSNGHTFSHGCPIQAHNISRHSKLNNGGSREIPMVITYHTDVRFGDIIYRDVQN